MSDDVYDAACATIRKNAIQQKEPRPFGELLAAHSTALGDPVPSNERILLRASTDALTGSSTARLAEALAVWDAADVSLGWCAETQAGSQARRQHVHSILRLPTAQVETLDRRWPIEALANGTVLVKDALAECWKEWVPKQLHEGRGYWATYQDVLADRAGWQAARIVDLGESADDVLRRLSDPTRVEVCPIRGLVVGYVQSGKTAHMLALTSKAIDAGFRLVIVLAGTTDLLREQTQRRFDAQLVGAENLNPSNPAEPPVELLGKIRWENVARFGGAPPVRITRLTDQSSDFRLDAVGGALLHFEPGIGALNNAERLVNVPARVAVIKKHPAIIERLLERLSALSDEVLAELPVLVIDDESDEASLDTTKPSARWATGADDADDDDEATRVRTATNKRIVELLAALPRTSYVGYTATPFANVFVDPSDPEDLFPRDFVLALDKPPGYMGAAEFHDLEPLPDLQVGNPAYSRRAAFVREVTGSDQDDDNLQRALDSFLLAGAVKLYRKSRGVRLAGHHTMLVHATRIQVEQNGLADLVRSEIARAAWNQAAGAERLGGLYNADFLRVSLARSDAFPVPTWQELLPWLPLATNKVTADAVMVVNGEPGNDGPDFESSDVWAILVGGAKLSRGYTIEGLTTSYFRRRAGTASALMQMGRWFGYRRGYADLVRLFIGTAELQGQRTSTIDLYEAFEMTCRDEEAFRSELMEMQDNIRPVDLPPLVTSHAPWLPPVSRNKMWNAIVDRDWSGRWTEPTLAPTRAGQVRANHEAFTQLLGKASQVQRTTDCVAAVVGPEYLLAFAESYSWLADANPMASQLQYLRDLAIGERSDPISSWVLVLPRLKGPALEHRVGDVSMDIQFRSRPNDGRVGAYSTSDHRAIALDRMAEQGTRVGALLGYALVHDENDAPKVANGELLPTIGWALRFPGTVLTQPVVRYRAPGLRNRAAIKSDES